MNARAAAPIGVLVAALGLAIGGQVAVAARPKAGHHDPLYLPNPRYARHLALGFGPAWADVLHIQALLYVSREFDSASKKYRWLAALYDAMTTLDPRFLEAYLYGAKFLTILRKDQDAAIRLLEKGIVVLPDRWELYNELGMIWFMDRKDRATALHWLRKAAERPDCPLSVTGFVAAISRGTDSDQDVLKILQDRLERTRDPMLRKALEWKALQHAAELLAKRLELAVAAIAAETGARPATLAEARARVLAAAGTLRDRLADALEARGPFRYDRSTGRVVSEQVEALQAEQMLAALHEAVELFREQHGRLPGSKEALEAFAQFRRLRHPRPGWTFRYDPATGTFSSVPEAPLDPPRTPP